MKKISSLLAFIVLFSSCASVFTKRYQKITIVTDPESEILVDGVPATREDGKILLKRDYAEKQITIKREGFHDENIVAPPYKKAPLYIMSWIPFVVIGAPFVDVYKKSYNYPKVVTVDRKVKDIETKPEESKNILVNNASFNVDSEDFKQRYFYTYKRYLRKKDKKEPKSINEKEKLNIDKTIFADALNEILIAKGYVDTTATVLKGSYNNNLYVDATITGLTVHETNLVSKWSYYSLGRVYYMDLDIEWDILNFYKEKIYSVKTSVTSGQFAATDEEEGQIAGMYNAIKDAFGYGFTELMSDSGLKEILEEDNDILEDEKLGEPFSIYNQGKYVSNLNEAITSSVTIKGPRGHGSGFIIGSNGFVITNYHVISLKDDDRKVILNNGESVDFEVIRVSKSNDLALLKIDKNGLLPFELNTPKEYTIAEDIYAVGTPTAQDLSQSVSRGIISGIRDLQDGNQLIQTDASINSGNSGGALVNKQGKVQGVVSSKVKGFGIEGVAFGIPSYQVLKGLKIQIEN